jgi:hypothetical protein
MKKISLLLLTLPFLCISCANFSKTQNTIPKPKAPSFLEVSTQDQEILAYLNAKKQDFSYQDNALLLGDDSKSAKQKQLFLIHNRSQNPIVLDFPQGHTGATAGIMQMIQPGEWYAYLYVKGKDYRRIEPSTGKSERARPTWTCQKGNPNYQKYNSCKTYLDIYSVDYNLDQLKEAKNILDYKLLNILNYYTRTQWITHISYPSVRTLLMKTRVIIPKHANKK